MASARETRLAHALFAAAEREDREWELLECLFNGGTATIDTASGRLVLVDAQALSGLMGDD